MSATRARLAIVLLVGTSCRGEAPGPLTLTGFYSGKVRASATTPEQVITLDLVQSGNSVTGSSLLVTIYHVVGTVTGTTAKLTLTSTSRGTVIFTVPVLLPKEITGTIDGDRYVNDAATLTRL